MNGFPETYEIGRWVCRLVSCSAAALLCAVWTPAAFGQDRPEALFSEESLSWTPRPGFGSERATLRSRAVRADPGPLSAARHGREPLRLNLFDDADFEVRVDRVRPTRTGSFLTGRVVGMEWSDVALVVSGSVVVGSIQTPRGSYTIRSGGFGRLVIRQIDPSALAEGAPPLPPSPPEASETPTAFSQEGLRGAQVPARLTEDGSRIDALVVYTQGAKNASGGTSGIRALIDLWVAVANTAYSASGVSTSLRLVHTEEVNYVQEGIDLGNDLDRLRFKSDGYLDQIHALRDRYAADVVALVVTNPGDDFCAITYQMRSNSLSFEDDAFSVISANECASHSLAHEFGHNLGVAHDRYSGGTGVHDYSHGYVNQKAFEPGAPTSARWRTVMAYRAQCLDSGFNCLAVAAFSNPDRTGNGDPLGVPHDSTEQGVKGPADARRTINATRSTVASFRSRSCTGISVSPDGQSVETGGGQIRFRVTAGLGCVWEANSHSSFLTITYGAVASGNGTVTVSVSRNGGNAERTGTLTIAGKTVTVRQTAGDVTCGRTARVSELITEAAGITSGDCTQLTPAHLAQIVELDMDSKGVASLRSNDFSGLPNLRRLFLGRNQLFSLPRGLFAGLGNLEVLDLSGNPGSVFTFRMTPKPRGSNQVVVEVDPGAPFEMSAELTVQNGTLDGGESSTTVTIPAGGTASAPLTVSRSGGTATVSLGTAPPVPSTTYNGSPAFQGIATAVGSPAVLGSTTVVASNRSPRFVTPTSFSVAENTTAVGQVSAVDDDGPDIVTGYALADPAHPAFSIDADTGDLSFSTPPDYERPSDGAANNRYVLQVLATSGAGGRTRTATQRITVIVTDVDEPPAAPAEPALREVSANTLKAIWAAPENTGPAITSYDLQYRESGSAPFTDGPRNVVETSAMLPDLTEGTRYEVQVRATNAEGDSPWSPPATATAAPPSPPGQASGVMTVPGVKELTVSWDPESRADGYKLQWKVGVLPFTSGRQRIVEGGGTTSDTIPRLVPGLEYVVRVISTRDYAPDGPPSEVASGTPRAEAPGQVSGVALIAGPGRLDVSWTPLPDTDGYKIQWKSGTEEFDAARQGVVEDSAISSYMIRGLPAGVEYTVQVIATRNNADDGPPSETATLAVDVEGATLADVNSDSTLDEDDALVLYYAYALQDLLGDGTSGGVARFRQTLLAGRAGRPNPSDADLTEMLHSANLWKQVGVGAGGDLNQDGVVDEDDALVLYYAYALQDLLGDGASGGVARFRQTLLAGRAGQPNPSDADLQLLLRRANELRALLH